MIHPKTRVAAVVAATATAAVLTACGGSSQTAESSGGAAQSAAPTSGSSAPRLTDQQAPTARLLIDLTIADGTATPTNQQFQARVGEPIVIRVNSDAADELHVHSNPEHSFEVKAENGQQFQFTVDVPGRVDVELHHLDKTVATIAVQQ